RSPSAPYPPSLHDALPILGRFACCPRRMQRTRDTLSRNFPFSPGGYIYMRVGLDIGSTTIKCVVLDDVGKILFSTYERHFSHILDRKSTRLNSSHVSISYA